MTTRYAPPNLVSWLFELHQKKATFVLIGQTNCGKSYFAKLIEDCTSFMGRIIKDSVFSWSQLRFSKVGLWEETTITQDDMDSTKLILEGVKTPVAIKGKDPFILKKRTPIFTTSNTEIHQHVSSQVEALASRYYRFKFDREMLHYPFHNKTHNNCIRLWMDPDPWGCRDYSPVWGWHRPRDARLRWRGTVKTQQTKADSDKGRLYNSTQTDQRRLISLTCPGHM
jgi:hypothetical protein